ncbi:MAG: hypothetical protein HZB47_03680 [Nitrosomonadales bacterium]|nr:hypothetical protein [Nitrosomonadales bacterium]
MSAPIRATVVDAKTQQPVSGAQTSVVWEIERPRFFHGHDLEYFEQKTVTATDGSFSVPGWGPKLINGHVSANYPQVTIIREGNVQTTHINAWSGFGGGTVCNGQFTTNTTEWWHSSVVINVTWNGCNLAAYSDEATLAAAKRIERIKYFAAFAEATSSSAKGHYLWLFGDFISAKSIAQSPSEITVVQEAFCKRLIDTHDTLTDAEKVDLRATKAGYPPAPVDHDTYVLPYCTTPQ